MIRTTMNSQWRQPGLLLCVAASLLVLAGCASFHKDKPVAVEPVAQPRMPPVHVDGSIYSAGTEMRLFEDIKARRVGDILTVMLVEQNSGVKSSDNKMTQSTDMNITPPVLGSTTRGDLGLGLSSANKFAGESGTSQSNSLSGSVTVTVMAVLPGGNLRVQGEKWMEINQGKEYIKLDGVIRPSDVKTNNTILSTQIADAHISYSGKGSTADASVMGWVGKVLFSAFRPF